MRRTIGREVETALATRILEGSLGMGDYVRLVGRSTGSGADLRARVDLECVRAVDTEAVSL